MTQRDLLPPADLSASLEMGEARMKVFQLPGMDDYRTKIGLDPDTEDGLDKIIGEVTDELEADSEVSYARNKFGWSDEQYAEFLSIPERKPFQSLIQFDTDTGKKQDQFLTLGQYLRLKHKSIEDPSKKEQAGKTLARFYKKSMEVLFNQRVFDWTDKYTGVDTEKRHSGDIEIDPATGQSRALTAEMSQFMIGIAGQDDLYKQVLKVTRGGNFVTIEPFLQGIRAGVAEGRRTDEPLREALEQIVNQRARDKSLAAKKLQIVWDVERYRLAMGIDLDTYYSINGFKTPASIKEILEAELTDSKGVDELRSGIESEINAHNQILVNGQKIDFPNGSIGYWQIFRAYTTGRDQLPDHAESEIELEQKLSKIKGELSNTTPILVTSTDSQRNYFEAPYRIGATHRPYNAKYKNEKGEQVNIQLLNPSLPERILRLVTAHEATHKVHDFMLDVAVDNGDLTEQLRATVPDSVYEMFAVLVEKQAEIVAAATASTSVQETTEGQEVKPARTFNPRSLIGRRQNSYALCQLRAREMLEQRWNNLQPGDLSDQEAEEILNRLQVDLNDWYAIGGLNIVDGPRNFGSNNIEPTLPFDGAIYIPTIIGRSEQKEEVNVEGLNQAFVDNFGPKWLSTKEGQLVLLGLLVHSGEDHNIAGYPEYIKSVNLDELRKRFSVWSLPENFSKILA